MLSRDARTFLDSLDGIPTYDQRRPYCYRADETGEWYWLTEADLERYVAMGAGDSSKHAQIWHENTGGSPTENGLYSEWRMCSGELMTRADALRLNLIDADDDCGE